MNGKGFNIVDLVLAFGAAGHSPLIILKLVIMFGLSIYLVFGLVVMRQVGLMTSTIKTNLTPSLKLLSYVHMIVAVVVWFMALVVL